MTNSFGYSIPGSNCTESYFFPTAKGFIYFLQNIYLIVAIVIGKTYDFSFTHAQGNIPVV